MHVETTDLRETDVVRLQNGQEVEVTFDSLPDRILRRHNYAHRPGQHHRQGQHKLHCSRRGSAIGRKLALGYDRFCQYPRLAPAVNSCWVGCGALAQFLRFMKRAITILCKGYCDSCCQHSDAKRNKLCRGEDSNDCDSTVPLPTELIKWADEGTLPNLRFPVCKNLVRGSSVNHLSQKREGTTVVIIAGRVTGQREARTANHPSVDMVEAFFSLALPCTPYQLQICSQ